MASTAQIWALHDALGAEVPYRAAAGRIRWAGASGGVRATGSGRGLHASHRAPDPAVSERSAQDRISRWPIPIPQDLALTLSAHVEEFGTDWVICDEAGRQMGPWQPQRAFRAARAQVPGLPEGFRFHDLRHYYASLLINSGLDVKVVQTRLRHASAKTTLDTYGHIFPNQDETTRAAISTVMTTRNGNSAATVRPSDAVVRRLSSSEAGSAQTS